MLMTEQLIPFRCAPGELFDRTGQSIPTQASGFPYRRTKAGSVMTNKVHIDTADDLATIFCRRKPQNQMGRIFNIDLQITLTAQCRLDPSDITENPT